MNDSKSLLPIADQYVGSYFYATQLFARISYLGLGTALSYKNCQIGGGAFTGGVTSSSTEPTICRLKVAGLVTINATCISADGADLAFKICIRQPGDSTFRNVTDILSTLKAASAVRTSSSITLPLPAGSEIALDGTAVRTALDEGAEQMFLSVGYVGLSNTRTNIRYGS